MAIFDFLIVSKTLKSFANELAGVRLEIETLTRQVEDIHYAPAHPDDVLAALQVWAESNAAEYRTYLKIELGKLFHRPSILSLKHEVKSALHMRGIVPEPHLGLQVSRDVQMCGLLGPAGFMELMKKQLQAIDWPAPGLRMEERPGAMAALEKKIKTLQTREAELIASADKAGLSVS